MATRRRFLVLLAAGGTVAAAAAAGIVLLPADSNGSGLPKIRYGQETCVYCGMTIDDERFAAAWRTRDGAEQHFDDIGCMVNQSRKRNPGADARLFVHDYNDSSWLDASTASYVIAASIKTPMAYGLVAVASHESAGSIASRQQGVVYEWSALLTTLEKKG